MVRRSEKSNAFEFVKISALRTAQLMQGCRARVPEAARSVLTAQLEVAGGFVQALPRVDVKAGTRP